MGNVITGAFRDTANDLIEDNLADGLATNRYIHFTMTPSEAIDLKSFQATLGGTNTAGPADYTVGLGVFSSLSGAGGFRSPGRSTPLSIDLSTNNFLRNISDLIEFRIYHIDDRATAHSSFNVRMRDVTVEAVAIPEPATAVLALGVARLLVVFSGRGAGL